MKKLFIPFVLLTSALCAGCGTVGPQGEKGEKGDQGEQGVQGVQGIQGEKGDQGERGPQGEKGESGETPKIDLSKFEDKAYYRFDFFDEENTNKVVRPGFKADSEKYYNINTRADFDEVHKYEWFYTSVRIHEGAFECAWNEGYISTINSEDPFNAHFCHMIELYKYNIVEFGNKYYVDDDANELLVNENYLIVSNDQIYYSEDYLISKGVSFYDYEEIFDSLHLELID